jgi:hypothetical protein
LSQRSSLKGPTSETLHADLAHELEAQKELMVAVSTGGPRIHEVNGENVERNADIQEALAKLGVRNPEIVGT